jgi:hypothetical protein
VMPGRRAAVRRILAKYEIPVATAAMVALGAGHARAQEARLGAEPDPPSQEPGVTNADGDNPTFPIHATRRKGFTVGVVGGLQIVEATGTPTAFEERNPAHRTDTGLTLVPLAATVFVGGAFTDWLSLHVGGTASHFERSGLAMTQAAFVFRLEAWPLFPLGGVLRDIGVGGEFGTGMSQVTDSRTGDELADGGGLSLIGVNVFWDAARLGGLGVGPFVGYVRSSNETFLQQAGWLGLRTVFHAGP